MPQTISLVRGTTSVSGNGTSNVTLFTNSASGIATRVIVNQLTFYTGQGVQNSSNLTINLYHQSSGGYNSIVGQISTAGGTPPRTEQWSLGNDLQHTIGAGTNTFGSDGYSMGSGDTGVGSQDVLFWSAQSTRIEISSTPQRTRQCPQNFWIGPSDVLRIKSSWTASGGKGGSPQTVNIGYSFTLITES